MPPLPKRKRSLARQNKRLAHTARKPMYTSPCPTCGNARMAHRACPTCGTYNGRQVITPRQGARE